MQLESRMVNVQRCLSLLDVPQEKIEGDLALEVFKERYPTWPDQGNIQFNNVVLRYRPDTEIVLNKLSFEVKPGEKIGVVGRTGAGKSTICLSLSRIVDIIEGAIMIDNIEVRAVHLDYLRSLITVIPQDPTMFTGTLRFNLDPKGLYTNQRIIQVL